MNTLINDIFTDAYPYADRMQKTNTKGAVFGTRNRTVLPNSINTVTGQKNNLSFPEVFSAVRGANKEAETNAFSAAFPTNDVSIKAGNCEVDDEIWQRKDFPAWRYFQEDADADCLNHWKPRTKEATGKEAYIQNELKKVGSGKMAVIMPESLQEKMNAAPELAREIAEKVQDWKINYDKMDNALAASYGKDAALYQRTKSYCLQLNEKGDVKRYMVVDGGTDTKKSSGTDRADTQTLQNALVQSVIQMTLQNGAANMLSNYGQLGYANYGLADYSAITPYLVDFYK